MESGSGLDAWAYFNKVRLDYSQPGTPTDNPHIESFNGSFRDESLNMNWFMSLKNARTKIERWRRDYNEFRPHSAPTYLTPANCPENRRGSRMNIDFSSLKVDYDLGDTSGGLL